MGAFQRPLDATVSRFCFDDSIAFETPHEAEAELTAQPGESRFEAWGYFMRRNILVLLVLALVGSLLAVAAAGAEGTPSALPPRGPTPETWMPPSRGVPPSEDSNYLDQSRRAYADDYNAILKGGVLVPVASSGFDPINPPTGLVAPGVAIPSGGDEWSYDAKTQKWTSPTGADPFPGEQ